MVNIPTANFEPDKSRFNGGTVPLTLNVLPASDGWSPMPGPGTPLSSFPVPGTVCLNGFHAKPTTGGDRYFAFTPTKIYEYDPANAVGWKDVTRTSGGDYIASNQWSIAVFGDYIYAQNGLDVEQRINLNSETNFANTPGTPPVARYIATIGDFLVRLYCDGIPNKIQWSGLNDPSSNTVGLDGCDYQLFADGGAVSGIIPMSFGALIVLDSAFMTMNFALSSEYVFTFTPLTKKRGSTSPYSIAVLNQDDFIVYCDDGFFRGTEFQPIGAERVDNWFVSQTDAGSRTAMSALVDPQQKIVWFRYKQPSLPPSQQYRLLGYDWQLDRWCLSDLQIQTMFQSRTPSITWDGLNALFANIDAVNLPYDSAFYDAGTALFAIITSNGLVTTLSGGSQAATLETNELSLNDTSRAFVNGARLAGDAVDVSVTPYTTDYKGGALTARPVALPSPRTRFIPMRADGRLHKFKIEVPAGTNWSIISGLDVEATAGGRY